MNMDKFGIVITFIILGSVMVVASLSSGTIDVGSSTNIPQINAGTNTDTDAYWQYCYKMNIDNC